MTPRQLENAAAAMLRDLPPECRPEVFAKDKVTGKLISFDEIFIKKDDLIKFFERAEYIEKPEEASKVEQEVYNDG